MQVSDFDYELPPGRIAQHPAEPRDAARLMVLGSGRPGGSVRPGEDDLPVEHHLVSDLPRILHPGDLLVLNDTRVFPARLQGLKETGGRIEVLLLSREEGETEPGRQRWRAALGASRMPPPGGRIHLGAGLRARMLRAPRDGEALIELEAEGEVSDAIERLGEVPLPPYIVREHGETPEDRERYQTVFARVSGAAAAPTAGLHFTADLLGELARRGIGHVFLTLHVGLGTFQPVRADSIEGHRMHAEWYQVPAAATETIRRTRGAGGRIVAVGTTVVRALEQAGRDGELRAGEGWCDLFITPGFVFRQTDLIMTNFHLPRSTLLMLVAAFAGRDRVLRAYRLAVARGYRFYSYGDAMLIEPGWAG